MNQNDTKNDNNEVVEKRMFPLTSAKVPMPKVKPPKESPNTSNSTTAKNDDDKLSKEQK